jgi:CRISPR-associated protein Cas6/Cse3/CasE subtype I-E
MYLTNLPSIQGDDYKQHQNVRQVFPGTQRVLFQQHDCGVTVISDEKPVEDLNTKEIDETSFVVGGQYPFTVRLNPSKRDIKTHKKVPIDSDFVKAWIGNKLLGSGVDAKFQYIKEGVRRSVKQGKTISLVSVLCFGLLTIKDTETFSKALKSGIGAGKGLGFGMLNIF